MKKIDIFDSGLCDEIINDNEPYIITANGIEKYILMPYENYIVPDGDMDIKPQEVRVIAPDDIEINEVEYEKIKQQLLDALDEALGPNIKKLS